MLLDLRETVRNSKPIKYTLITLICIPFALVGIGSYFSGGSATPVAEVNGQPIVPQQLERAYQQQRQQLARMFGGQLPPALANETLLREQALEQLITQQVLESEVENQRFAVGDETLGRAIRELPNFQVDGKFNKEAYQLQLRSSGLSVPAFEQSYRDDTAINQFRFGISGTSFTLPQEADQLSELARQTRTVEAVRFDFEKAKSGIESTEEEIVAYFEANKDSYTFPQRAKIEYIELNVDDLAEAVDISEAEAQTYYDENRANFIRPEQRDASHILLSADEGDADDQVAKLAEVKARIEAGESFSELAKEISDDVGSADLGGSLGTISPGSMVAAFEEAVFSLEAIGAVSDPVVTEFGVHLIKLDNILPEAGKPFEEVSAEIVESLKQDEADGEYFDLRELLVEYSFDNPDSLEAASDATGLDIKSSDWLDADTDSGPLLSNPQVVQAMFSDEVLQDEINSELIEVEPRHVVIIRVTEHEGPRPKTIDDVREEVADTLNGEKATESLSALRDAAIEKLVAGNSAAEIAGSDDFATALEQVVVDRASTEFDRNVVAEVFGLPKPGGDVVTHVSAAANGDLLALRLDSIDVQKADDEAVDSDIAAPANGLVEAGADLRRGGTEFEVFLQSLRAQADIDISTEPYESPYSNY
ncbi:MAG: SurA N-terminal domain-containing protein [Granulosicoccus sp.]